MPFVLDNSVVTGWYLPDQASSYSQAIATRLESDKALVPALPFCDAKFKARNFQGNI